MKFTKQDQKALDQKLNKIKLTRKWFLKGLATGALIVALVLLVHWLL